MITPLIFMTTDTRNERITFLRSSATCDAFRTSGIPWITHGQGGIRNSVRFPGPVSPANL